MHALHTTIFSLQGAFPAFLRQPHVKKPLSDVEKEALKLFSSRLKSTCDERATALLFSIRKNWTVLCQELCRPTEEPLSPDFIKRVTKVQKKLVALGQEVQNGELIFDLLKDPEVSKALENKVSPQAKSQLRLTPKAIEHLKIMTERICSGVYGSTLQKTIFDLLKSPLLIKELLVRMLYIDLHFRDLDPILTCEWFCDCDVKDNRAIRECLLDQKVALSETTALPECEIRAILIGKGVNLPRAVQKRLETLLKASEITNSQHGAALEHIRPYFVPSNEVLYLLAQICVERGDFQKAMQIALRLDDKKMIGEIFDLVAANSLDSAKTMICHLQIKFPGFSLENELEELAKAPEAHLHARFNCMLRLMNSCPTHFLTKLVTALSIKPLTMASNTYLKSIFSHATEKLDRLELLETCFHAQLGLDPFDEALVRSKLLIIFLQDPDSSLYLSSLLYIAHLHPKQPEDSELLTDLTAELTDKTLRLQVVSRLVIHNANSLKKLENSFVEPEEKLMLLKARIRHAHKTDPALALELVNSVSDSRMKIALKRLCSTSSSPRLRLNFDAVAQTGYSYFN